MQEIDLEALNVPATDYIPDFSDEQMNETRKYLDQLRITNKKLYNKYKKQGRKFSDNIMSRLK